MQSLEDVSVNGKRVLVRIDANIPILDGKATDNFRLEAVAPTIHFLLSRFAKVILVSHLGRPKGAPEPNLSLKPVYDELSRILGKPIQFAPEILGAATTAAVNGLKEGEILGIENIRFDKGEEDNSRTFARSLAAYGDLYVNDALSVSHREAASVVAITEFLPSYAGLLLEREYNVLTNLLRHPAQPFVAIIGGAKIDDKLPVIQQLLRKADTVLVGGGVANTFLAASGVDMKKSLVSEACFDAARAIIKSSKGKLILPVDYTWSDDQVLDIGPKTIAAFEGYIKRAKTIFWNGNVGMSEKPEFAKGSEAIGEAIAATDGTTILAGGNTIEVCNRLGLLSELSFVSSGGGATLELLGGRKLPGIVALG